MDDEEEFDELLDAIRKLNLEQNWIILGILATMQAFDDDAAAMRWIERNRSAIRARIKDAE